MPVKRPIYHMLKVSVEALSPHAIHTGEGNLIYDTLILRDANGLPTLSGTSIKGVLRHEYQRRYGKEATESLFGFVKNKQSQASRLNVYWGFIHNSADQAKAGLLSLDELREVNDIANSGNLGEQNSQILAGNNSQVDTNILTTLLDNQPIKRDRVSINDRGVAKPAGKFDVALVPAGARYSFWLSYKGEEPETQKADAEGHQEVCKLWQNLIALLTTTHLRIGHGTNRGYGLFKILRLHQGIWDLSTPTGRQAFCSHRRTRMNYQGLQQIELDDELVEYNSVAVQLRAEGGWRIGGGERMLSEPTNSYYKEPDLLPVYERRIKWSQSSTQCDPLIDTYSTRAITNDNNQLGILGQPEYLLPATAIAGTLRHRVAYHYNRLLDRFVDSIDRQDEPNSDKLPFETDDSPAVKLLFGYANADKANASMLEFRDIYLDASKVTTHIDQHNRIDDYTSGVITGGLFSEQYLWKTNIDIIITLSRPDIIKNMSATETAVTNKADIQATTMDMENDPKLIEHSKQALLLAIQDLATGRLGIGASTSKGLGTFKLRQDGKHSLSELKEQVDRLFELESDNNFAD